MIDSGRWIGAVVGENLVGRSVYVTLVGRYGDHQLRAVTGIGSDGLTYSEPVGEDTRVETTLEIPVDLAVVLLDALAQHFGGTSDTRTLRRDYDAERKRVDDMIATLRTVAEAALPLRSPS